MKSEETTGRRGVARALDYLTIYARGRNRVTWICIAVMFACWFAITAYSAVHHAVWRDEARALAFALSGNNIFEMLQAFHGDGHPADWYLLLRGGYAVVGHTWVLQLIAFAIAFAAIALLCRRSPFSLPVLALIVFSHYAIFEYSVSARNYGISMLFMFIFAAIYKRYRDRGIALGVVLFLLANSNVHSALIVASTLLFWLSDIVFGLRGAKRLAALRVYFLNACLAVAGVVTCFLEIYPPTDDAAVMDRSHLVVWKHVIKALLLPADQFYYITHKIGPSSHHLMHQMKRLGLSLFLFATTLGLIRRPALMAAALASMLSMSLLFAFVYDGGYRHSALWLSFLISLYWLAETTRHEAPAWTSHKAVRAAAGVGQMAFVVLLGIQTYLAYIDIQHLIKHVPFSRSRDVAALVNSRPDLKNATIIGDPDYNLEPLWYYIPNKTYLMRIGRYGTHELFSTKLKSNLSLHDVLTKAREIHGETHRPVLIILGERLGEPQPHDVISESYNWKFAMPPVQRREFLGATKLLESYAPAVSDESYDVYELAE